MKTLALKQEKLANQISEQTGFLVKDILKFESSALVMLGELIPSVDTVCEELRHVNRLFRKWHRLKKNNAINYGKQVWGETAPYCGHAYCDYEYDGYRVRVHESEM